MMLEYKAVSIYPQEMWSLSHRPERNCAYICIGIRISWLEYFIRTIASSLHENSKNEKNVNSAVRKKGWTYLTLSSARWGRGYHHNILPDPWVLRHFKNIIYQFDTFSRKVLKMLLRGLDVLSLMNISQPVQNMGCLSYRKQSRTDYNLVSIL